MDITIASTVDNKKEMKIILDWKEVQEEYNDLLERYRKVSLKGFRPGKAPVGLVESTFRNEIKNDLASACSSRFCRTAMQERQLEAASPLEISDIHLEKDHRLLFTADFIEMPAFDLPDYAHLNLTGTSEEEKIDEISLKLLEKTDILVHPELIQNELKYSEDNTDSEERKKSAEDRIKLMLILKKIASKDQIKIDEKDVDERIDDIAQENEITSDQLREYLISNGALSRFSDTLLAEQVFQYIIEIQE